MGLKYTKRAMTSYEVHRFFHGLEISFFPDTLFMEMRGIEPLSKRISSLTSTIIVILLKIRFDNTPYNRAKLSKLT